MQKQRNFPADRSPTPRRFKTTPMSLDIILAHAGLFGGNEYADWSCAMGYCCTVRCYNAPHAYELLGQRLGTRCFKTRT